MPTTAASWKVAYADFVTAMMAFFLVMWIIGMDEQTKQAIEGYFSNPVGYKRGYSAGASPLSSGSSPSAVRQPPVRLIIRAYEQKRFSEVSQRLEERFRAEGGAMDLGPMVEVTVTEAGLRIELIEGGRGDTFFGIGSSAPTERARGALGVIAGELRGLANPVVLEGHTDAAQYGASGSYTNWELSADRANAARRILESAGVSRRPHRRRARPGRPQAARRRRSAGPAQPAHLDPHPLLRHHAHGGQPAGAAGQWGLTMGGARVARQVRECGSAGVRECGSAGVRECGSAGVREYGSTEYGKYGKYGSTHSPHWRAQRARTPVLTRRATRAPRYRSGSWRWRVQSTAWA